MRAVITAILYQNHTQYCYVAKTNIKNLMFLSFSKYFSNKE